MALPSGIQTCIMTGTLLDDAGNPLTGQIWLTPSMDQLVSASTNTLVFVKTKSLQLDATGSFTVPLICSSEASIAPSGVTWNLTTTNANPLNLTFYVPNDQTSANVSNYIIGISSLSQDAVLIGYRGPQGLPGVASDSALAALVNSAGSATRTALNTYYVPTSLLVISPTAPSSPAVGTVWINNS